MTPHGPDYECFNAASNAELKPVKVAVGTQVKILYYFERIRNEKSSS
jgi:homogentisate 1,2-dioxygenase